MRPIANCSRSSRREWRGAGGRRCSIPGDLCAILKRPTRPWSSATGPDWRPIMLRSDEYRRNTVWARSIPDHGAEEVIIIGALDLHGGEFAHPQRPARRQVDRAVDLGSVTLGSAFGPTVADFIDDDLLSRADVALKAARRDRLLALHETVPALFFDLIRHGLGEIIGSGAFHRLVAETADPVERRFIEPVEQKGKFLFGLARKTDDEG